MPAALASPPALQRQIAGAAGRDAPARSSTPRRPSRLCLGGSLFFHSSINSAVRQSGLFERVFVPANPGNAGLAVGTAKRLAGLAPAPLSAFMGPSFDPDAIKSTLDNCKLRYDWMRRRQRRRAGGAPPPAGTARRMVRGPDGVGTTGAWGSLDPGEPVLAVRARESQPVPEASGVVARLRAEHVRGRGARALLWP